jgi:hypothetical protein
VHLLVELQIYNFYFLAVDHLESMRHHTHTHAQAHWHTQQQTALHMQHLNCKLLDRTIKGMVMCYATMSQSCRFLPTLWTKILYIQGTMATT